MVNIPGLFFLYGTAVCLFYGLVGAGAWAAGRAWDRPLADGLGRSFVVASGGTFLGYTAVIAGWLLLAGERGGSGLGGAISIVLFATAPMLPFVPPAWAIFRYTGDESGGEPSSTPSQD